MRASPSLIAHRTHARTHARDATDRQRTGALAVETSRGRGGKTKQPDKEEGGRPVNPKHGFRRTPGDESMTVTRKCEQADTDDSPPPGMCSYLEVGIKAGPECVWSRGGDGG
jgi:hypothetical protein